MSFLYYTKDKSVQGFGQGVWSAFMMDERDHGLDVLVSAGVIGIVDVPESVLELGEDIDIDKSMIVVRNDGSDKIIVGTYSDALLGILVRGGPSGNLTHVIRVGNAAVRAGEIALPLLSDAVTDPLGQLVPYDDVGIEHLAETVLPETSDFDNSVWKSGGEVINIRTDVDDATAQSAEIELFFLNENGLLDSETIILNAVDSSIIVSGSKLCTKLLSINCKTDIDTVDLIIEDEDANASATITAPEILNYGYIEMTTPASNGHQITITADPAITGTIVVVGTDHNDDEVIEYLEADAGTELLTTRGYKTIVGIYFGDDNVTTVTLTVTVAADVVGDKVTWSRFTDIPAMGYGMIDIGT